MRITNSVSLDFGRSGNPPTVYAKQGDARTRYIAITPLSNGMQWNIPDGVTAHFACRKPDGKHVYLDTPVIENNIITVELSDQTLVVAGKSVCDIILLTADGKILSSQNFYLETEYSPGAYAELESTDEVQSLYKLIESIETKLENGEFTGEDGKSAYKYAVQGGYTDTEEKFYKDLANVSSGGTVLSDSLPLMDGEAAAGESEEVSRADHVHPTDTTRMPAISEMVLKFQPASLDRLALWDYSASAMKSITWQMIIREIKTAVTAVATADTANSVTDTVSGYKATLPELSGDAVLLIEKDLAAHNTSDTAHSDIRLLIDGLALRLNAIADSDDTTLDQLSEIVAYIKSNKDLIDSITTSKVSVADIVNDLVTNVTDKPLSAAQGVYLKMLIDEVSSSKLDTVKLGEALDTALTEVKESGEFDGADGVDGVDGKDGTKWYSGDVPVSDYGPWATETFDSITSPTESTLFVGNAYSVSPYAENNSGLYLNDTAGSAGYSALTNEWNETVVNNGGAIFIMDVTVINSYTPPDGFFSRLAAFSGGAPYIVPQYNFETECFEIIQSTDWIANNQTGKYTVLASAPFKWNKNRWYELAFELRSDRVAVYVDRKKIISYDVANAMQYIIFYPQYCQFYIDNVRVCNKDYPADAVDRDFYLCNTTGDVSKCTGRDTWKYELTLKGKDGEDGVPGYTPQNGIDYNTESEKQDMVNRVLAALPTWTGGVY